MSQVFVPLPRLPCPPPNIIPSPFAPGEPHPLALHAARKLQAELCTLIPQSALFGANGGKMFGVLVCVLDGQVGYLRGFAGSMWGTRGTPGFVPPLYDEAVYAELWAQQGSVIEAMSAQLARMPGNDPARAKLQARQRQASAALLPRLQALYRVPSYGGESCTLASLFAPRPVPGGAGDCAAPKLLAQAYKMGARPLALAEFWWGNPSPAGGRHHNVFYPACRGRCANILPFMLRGLDVEDPPSYMPLGVPSDAPWVRFEDDDMLVVEKPPGLLSTPGRGPSRYDSVQARLQARVCVDNCAPDWPRLVHRLDQATSGLLLAPKHKPAYVALQRQFSARTVIKRYIALLRGTINRPRGTIDLALRPDIDDRPRQMHDPIHGREAVTDWECLEHHGDTTRVAFYPRTGRSHQLRMHAAHPAGLHAPIVGDALYGMGEDTRLMLHAEALKLVHPMSGAALEFYAPAPF